MKVYLDNASTTNVSKEVYKAMKPYFKTEFGNPSSLHNKGISNRRIINTSKKTISKLLHCDYKEIHFTGSGSESINWALKGLAFKNKTKGEIITTRIEHHATLHTADFLESLGYIVHYLDVDKEGFVNTNQLRALISNNTLLVSIIMANNEIGTIQNVKEISDICKANSTYLHLDAVQVLCHVPFYLDEIEVDLVSFSGHKFHAPKGIGILYIRQGTKIENLIHGGQQEFDHRAGTENVAYIVGITKAIELGINQLSNYENQLNEFSNYFINELQKANIDYILNGPPIGANRLPGNINISFKDLDGSDLTYYLNKNNIFVSTGSACDSENIEPSHVLKTIGVPSDYINASIRFTIGIETTFEEVKHSVATLIRIINDVK